MTGYFSVSSINISRSFSETLNNTVELHSLKGMTCDLLKKIFKCEGITEEVEDYNTKESKTGKFSKGIPLSDYLIPSNSLGLRMRFQIDSDVRNYKNNRIILFDFHGRIHVPPPKNIA